jgi:hypothetical protein
MSQEQTKQNNAGKTWAYYLAWAGFISSVLGVLVSAFNTYKPPDKHDYTK